MSLLMGLLLLFCGQECSVPLPGHALEIRGAAAQRRWCLRAEDGSGTVCADEVRPRVTQWVARQPAAHWLPGVH